MPVKKLNLLCLVFPDNDPNDHAFQVEIDSDKIIGSLKEMIKLKQAPRFDDIVASDLILWRCSIPVGDDLEGTLNSVQFDPPDNRISRLIAARKLTSYFKNDDDALDDHLHVIAKAPDQLPHKRSRSPQILDNTKRLRSEVADWLLELHGKIWNQNGRQQELFRTVTVTTAHYKTLEDSLTKLYPDRQGETYSAGIVGVLTAKLAVLQSINSPSTTSDPGPAHAVDAVDDNDDNDDELCAIFPITFEYLDLSSLGLQNPPPRMPLPLLVRQEYNFLSKFLGKRPMNSDNSAIISGQPGIGKTTYLYLRLVQCMIAGISCLFISKENTVYHVSESITIVKSWSGGPIIAFFDADGNSSEPPSFIVENNTIQIIAASSPKGASEKWTDKMPGLSVMQYVTTLWSPHELFLTGLFLLPKDILYSRLKESTIYFGFNPRRCFDASCSSERLAKFKSKINTKILDIPRTDDLRALLSQTFSNNSLSHSVFQLFPSSDMRILGEAGIGAVSSWALDVLLQEYERRQVDASFQFYNSIVNTAGAETLRGQIFERQVLRYLGSLKELKHFEIRCLADSTTSQWAYPGPTASSSFQTSTFNQLLCDAVAHQKPLHLVPQDPKFPTVESILYNPGEVLAFIQITIQSEHPETIKGFKKIQTWLKLNTPLSSLPPSDSGHWQLIFVVPDYIEPGFIKQSFKDDTTTQVWSEKVDQYVLGIKEDTIWGRAME